jgi:zinc and cadmium transporter
MSTVWLVVIFSLGGGLFSLVGGALLLLDRKLTHKLLPYLTPFAAGALLAGAFIDILPEAIHESTDHAPLTMVLFGILGFFLLEQLFSWFHCHHHTDADERHERVTTPLIVIGDTIHNFLDGIAIAAAFLIDIPTGIVATIAIAAHEIPQEIADFGFLLARRMKPSKVLWVNVISSLATTVAAVGFFLLGEVIELPIASMLGLVAGFFIYIAVSDIIPSIHSGNNRKTILIQTLILIAGVIIVGAITTLLHAE